MFTSGVSESSGPSTFNPVLTVQVCNQEGLVYRCEKPFSNKSFKRLTMLVEVNHFI